MRRNQVIEARHVATGIVQALSMWADPRYGRYLVNGGNQALEEEWFRWFVGKWRVARTIRDGRLPAVVKYFNGYYPRMLRADTAGDAIDKAARALKTRKLSTVGKTGTSRLPLSMASKVAFLFQPQSYVPLDSYGRKGLNALRGRKTHGGKGYAKYDTYKAYLSDFNCFLARDEQGIRCELKADWVRDLRRRIGVTEQSIKSDAFLRKCFDNVLMAIAGR